MKPIRSLGFLAVILCLMPLAMMAQNVPVDSPFSITRSSTDGINIHFELPQWKLETVERGGETLQRVSITDAQYIFIDEEETLPVFATFVAIPYSGGVSLNMLGSQDQNRDRVTLDFDASLTRERANGKYAEALYPADQTLISEPQVLRDFRVVSVNIYPFQYDQARKQLVVRQSMDIRLDFNSNPSINEIAPPESYSSAFQDIYSGLILNYDEMLDREAVFTNPRLLVIYGNYSDATYLSKVNEYVGWKRQKGYHVTAVSTATAGTNSTAIKNYIQTQYNNTSTRPDYIVLIGDTSGNMAIPSYNTYIDYYYTWLAGSDNLGDVIIGRISVETTEQMTNYMAKIASLEQNIDLSAATWLDKMVLVGDTSSSGISTVYTNEYIHDHSLAVNPDYTYTEVYSSSPSSATINAAINQGVTFFNYRGYIGMSGWPNTMSSMNNGSKLFHAVFITCNTGSFGGGTSTTESVVRYGTAATLGGSVTAIGMATSSTHTPMNNCLNVGIFHGVYPLQMRDMGGPLLYGKLFLNAIYGVSNATQAYNFAGYCNLIGDPTASVYVSIPSTFTISAPDFIPAGTGNLEVTITSSGQPVAGASVAITSVTGYQSLATTGADGKAVLDLATTLSGSVVLTVNKYDFKPKTKTISIDTGGGFVFDGASIDDDTNDLSNGNNDGEANGGETIELYASLKNTTASTLTPSGDVSCTDPYVTLIATNRIEYNAIAPGGSGENVNPMVFQIAANCPDQHRIILNFAAESTGGNWTVMIPIVVSNGHLAMQSYTFIGATGNRIYPGDQFPMTISLTNAGSFSLSGVNAILRSRDMFFSVIDSLGTYGNITQGATVANSGDTFTVKARSSCIDGMVIPLELDVYNSAGFAESVYMTLTIGLTTVTDPLGQDAYGYFIFDDGDTGYDQCPTYQWIGIAPAEGGSGTALALTDPGNASDEGDQTNAVAITTVNLPFTFSYYGVDYTQASISSNGFIAFGDTDDADWRNWRLPDAGGPSPMIAVFWDDLDLLSGTSNVYTYYNSSQHYYVVEWYHMISGYDSSTQETFQAILYNPDFYPTHTGDGPIKLQYKDFNNIDLGDGDTYPHGNYCTIGIEDHTETIGLEYTFNNTYPTAAAQLSDESALFITTRPLIPDYPYLAIEQVNIVDPNSNNHLEPGESAQLAIRLGNRGLVEATGVSAVLSSSDPYVTITANSAVYGSVPAQGNAYPQTNYAVTVAANCPANHSIDFTLNITSNTGSWVYVFPLVVYVPELSFSNMIVNDVTGDHNGILDPGETAAITIHLNNISEIASQAGSATLTCATPGITINTGTDTFAAIAGGGYEVLSFSISAASSMTDGTLVSLVFSAVAGSVTATATENVEVGAPLEIIIGNGTGTQAYPLDRWYNYSGHEAIYLASEIGTAGTLKSIAFYKGSGADLNPISSVVIYMKNTTANSLSSGNYSTAGYTQVYSGPFTNNAASGWMEVNLSPMFEYDGVSNLSILTVKGYQQYINNYPNWTYSAVSPSRARQNHSDTSAPTNLLATANLPNLRLKIFPQYEILMPPQDLAASASHQSVLLTWSAPASGSPTGYRIYRNASLLTTVTGLTYTDLAVTDGTTYTYYLTAVYNEGVSDPSNSVTAIPNAIAPTNLTAVGGNTIVNLSWDAATGREGFESASSAERSISSYRIYRGGVPITTTTGTTYQDTGLANGTSYSYYVTTVYVNPAGESGPSNTATATPNSVSYVILGTGNLATIGVQNSPINISNNSCHGQSVYLAADLNAAGVTGPILITAMGFNVISSPNLALPNFLVRMKHTTATNAASWHDATDLVTTYSNASYMPVAGGWDMLEFTTPFQWNGTDNILIDTAFGLVATASQTGTLQYTNVSNSYRFAYSNTEDQTNVFSGGLVRDRLPNVRLALQSVPVGPSVSVSPTSIPFGEVQVGSNSVQHFTIQNTGGQILTGTVTTPAGYAVSEITRNAVTGGNASTPGKTGRNTITFSIAAGVTKTYSLTFAPTATIAYNGNVVIATNDADNPTVNIAVTGSGYIPPTISLDANALGVTLNFGEAGEDDFTITNLGSHQLTFTVTESPIVEWFTATPSSGTVTGGGNQLIMGSFSAAGMTPGTYQTTLQVASNDPDDPLLEVSVEMTVNNSVPTIVLPDGFAFDMDASLVVDFDPYVNDLNNQALILGCSGNTNVQVTINNLMVTFTATPGWYGTETLTFTVSDGIDTAFDTVPVTVNLTALPAPEISNITSSAGGGVSFGWNAVPGATQYNVYRSTDPYGTFTLIGTTTQTTYEDPGTYEKAFYQVRAVVNPPAK